MRKQVHLPLSKRKSYGSIAEEFNEANLMDLICRAAYNDTDIEIGVDPATAKLINDLIGKDVVRTEVDPDYD